MVVFSIPISSNPSKIKTRKRVPDQQKEQLYDKGDVYQIKGKINLRISKYKGREEVPQPNKNR